MTVPVAAVTSSVHATESLLFLVLLQLTIIVLAIVSTVVTTPLLRRWLPRALPGGWPASR